MAPNKPEEKPGSSANLRPDIVSNIPIKAPSTPLNPIAEDDELDKIMQDVGHDIKQAVNKRPRKKFLDFKRHPKATAPKPQPAPAAAALPLPHNSPAKPAPAKPMPQSSLPVLTIVVTIVITTVLIAAAVKAYK